MSWARIVEWPLTLAAAAFLAAYAAPIIEPGLPSGVLTLCRVVVWATWAMFALDFIVRLAMAQDRGRWALRHWLDILIIALPLLRPLRLLRLVTLLSVLNRRARSGLRGRVATYVAGGASLLGLCGALAVLDAERANPEANIVNFSDALWWAVTTMTTVGYGDRYPTTGQGRIIATGLMIGGIAILGVVTATLASWLVEHVSDAEQQQTDALRAELEELRRQVQLHNEQSPSTE